MRAVLALARVLLVERKPGPHDWPRVLPSLQTALNPTPLMALNSIPLARIGKEKNGRRLSPLEVMMAL